MFQELTATRHPAASPLWSAPWLPGGEREEKWWFPWSPSRATPVSDRFRLKLHLVQQRCFTLWVNFPVGFNKVLLCSKVLHHNLICWSFEHFRANSAAVCSRLRCHINTVSFKLRYSANYVFTNCWNRDRMFYMNIRSWCKRCHMTSLPQWLVLGWRRFISLFLSAFLWEVKM